MANHDLFTLDLTLEHDPAIDAWFDAREGYLGAIARRWFQVMRAWGDEVREIMHDGCPVACLGNAPFCYVNVFTAHVNVGFYQGALLPDPNHLLQGRGKRMRHVKLLPHQEVDTTALTHLIHAAFTQIKASIEHG